MTELWSFQAPQQPKLGLLSFVLLRLLFRMMKPTTYQKFSQFDQNSISYPFVRGTFDLNGNLKYLFQNCYVKFNRFHKKFLNRSKIRKN